ncbi:MAG: rhomboid family intramembrane serine protease [Ignisphaera sp.]
MRRLRELSYDWIWTPRRRERPIATYTLIAINVAIYIASSAQNFFSSVTQGWVDRFAYVPIMLQNPIQWYRILSSMFLHGDIFHIFFNMMFLYWFGKEIEQLLGIKRYLVLYLASGIVATIFHTGFTPIMGTLNLIIPALGASGAISGLLGAYLMLYPRRRLNICWFLFLIPLCFTTTALFFLLFWFATQVIYGYLRFGGIAFFAHVGGFIAGIALIYLLKRRSIETLHYFLKPYDLYTPKGLGSIAKTLLSILLIAVLIGSTYSTANAARSANVYIIDVNVCRQDTCFRDQAAYTPLGDEAIAPSIDLPRIAFNRLLWSGVIRNIRATPLTPISIDFRGNVVARDYGIRIFIQIVGEGLYDERGVLIEFTGSIVTDVINVNIWGIASRGDRIYIDRVDLKSQDVAKNVGEFIVRPFALISSFITLSSIFVVVFKDRDITEEEFLGPPIYTPWI